MSRAAIAALRQHFGTLRLSRVYENRAIGFDGAPFYNLVAAFDTTESPAALVNILHTIEQVQGRVSGPDKFSARSIDLDLLLYDQLVCDEPSLRLPRDEIRDYACVLGPLAELLPGSVHPETGETFAKMWSRFPQSRQPLVPVEIEL